MMLLLVKAYAIGTAYIWFNKIQTFKAIKIILYSFLIELY